TIIEANLPPPFSGAGEAQSHRCRDFSTQLYYIFVSLFFFNLVLVFSPFLSLLSSEFRLFGPMGSRQRSCCLKPSLSASLSLWIIFLSTLNSHAFTVTAPQCVSGSSPDEPFSRDSYLSKPMSIESVSSLWRSVPQSGALSAQEDLPVAATILWHLPCSLSFGMIVTLSTEKICSLSLLDEPTTSYGAIPPCSLHSLRYGNAEDQSCLGIVASDDVSELMEVDKLLSNYYHIILLGVATGTTTIHSLQIQKLGSVCPLNLTTLEKFIQPSSRQGRERSLSTSSKERTLPPKFISSREILFGDPVSEKKIFILTVLHSCVKVCLEPVDAAMFISMKFEVMDLYSKPHDKLAHQKPPEEIKVRLFSFSSVMLGLLDMSLDAVSNSFEFVSLSFYRFIGVVEALNLAIPICPKELIYFVVF
ncbi:hypothetical protein HID58_095692, partial [Brassica napus]